MQLLKTLGTVCHEGNRTKVYLSREALASPEIISLFHSHNDTLENWKKTFDSDICPSCLHKADITVNKNLSLEHLDLHSLKLEGILRDSLPYPLETVSLTDKEISDRNTAVIEMLEREIENNIAPLFSLIKEPAGRRWTVRKIAEKIADIILAGITDNQNSENIVKEITYFSEGGDILIIVPIEEAKETDQGTIERIASKTLAIIDDMAMPIVYKSETDIYDECIVVTVYFKALRTHNECLSLAYKNIAKTF